ncbi:pilus assembly protein PilP [Aeromonas molluscorum]|jgi:type IV pilus assembly protein PilP|uniref:Type IV pilus biogenesis protein TapP n=1 Tax=Aeromonas molluscorum 848 TaxID=1268236 RepID=R1H4L9_9GAMM|nr:pilus assembly protein PilP [Aeromonas molluscorum]EOD53419.1 type IV pilus biogenesis protein TapP [Aeromonas molluscorum 848]
MRQLTKYWFVLLLAGCNSQENMDGYISQIKARPPIAIEPLPVITPFSPLHYESIDKRNPFSEPQPESRAGVEQKVKADCAQIVANRPKEVLENYSLASLAMQGTMGKQGQLWALIRTPDGQSMRMGLNHYMGLDQGRVIRITNTAVDLLETVPDGKGCWVTRETQLVMANMEAKNNQ